MGRRAKNKQSAPEPLRAKGPPTPKKLGKRKAEPEADSELGTHPRPIKKLKDSGRANAHQNINLAVSSGGSSDGWEDLEDRYLDSHTK